VKNRLLLLLLAFVLTAAPISAQIPCTFCRIVPCPDAPFTICSSGEQTMTCQDWGECFPIEYLASVPMSTEQGLGNACPNNGPWSLWTAETLKPGS
jgi:hypothetical protein